jgi:acetyl esterase/lipase
MLRLVISIVLFLFSLLTVFPAPVYFLWYAAILEGEFPWLFMGLVLVVLAWGFRLSGMQMQLTATVFLLAALVLYLRPIMQASRIGHTLDAELAQAFGLASENNITSSPFSPLKMITGIGQKQLPYQTLTFDTVHNLSLDYYPSQIPGLRPCVIVIHGGSWRNGDSHQLPELNTVLAEAGYNVAAINYRKVPQSQSPAPVEDLHTALSYLRSNAASLHINPDALVLLGRSAGGQIALMGGYTMQDMGVKGVISYYGPADMIWGYQNPANLRIYNSCQVLEDYMGGSYSQKPARYAAGSPIEFVSPNSVPTLMIYGVPDVYVSYHHSTRLSKKLTQYHVPHYLLTLPWATHGFDYTLNGPGGQLATYSVLRFLEGLMK